MSKELVKVKATVMWAFLDKVNEMSGKYQVDLCDLSDEAVKALEEMGVECRKDPKRPEKGWFITCKSAMPIVPRDTDGDKITAIIGNGSVAKATIGYYDWQWKNKKGRSPSLAKLVITDLKEYVKPIDADDDDDEEL